MDEVFLLWHEHPENDDEEDDSKLLGVYSSEERALARIQQARSVIGFRRFPEGFTVARYVVDRDEWKEGFVSEYPDGAVVPDPEPVDTDEGGIG